MFPLLNKGARVFRNKLFLLRIVSLPGTSSSRFAFSISKKVAKSAVVRNRMRRTGYRLIKKYIKEIPSDLLVSFTFQNLPKEKIKKEIEKEVEENLKNILLESKLLK